MSHPIVLQGGMGAGVSDWRLANAVAQTGQLGTVSGTALDTILVRRLQDGDPGGPLRRAMEHFPVPEIVAGILEEYFIPGGKGKDEPYRLGPVFTVKPSIALQQLTVVANFVEVFLAKEGHEGLVGINYLEKIDLPNLASLCGAMLARVDYVVIGAGIPWQIPAALERLTCHETVSLRLQVEGATPEDDWRIQFDPQEVLGQRLPDLRRPQFIAIVASSTLATALARKTKGGVDGFVVEGPTAGGHNAPPRGTLRLNDRGEPIYGPRDEVDLSKVRSLGLPFWLAGGYDSPEKVRAALDAGASGVQIGTILALCEESALPADTRAELLEAVLRGEADVLTDSRASPAGFPFKVILKPGSLAEERVYEARPRHCDLAFLRTLYKRPDGQIGYRCPAEPVATYVRKGGQIEDTVGRKCLCNALMANIGVPQVRKTGYVEQPLLTAGDSLRHLARFVSSQGTSYAAADVIRYLLEFA